MRGIAEGREIDVFGDASTQRDYVYVTDVARLMMSSLEDFSSSDTFNLGTGIQTSVVELVSIFERVVGTSFRYKLHPRRPSDNHVAVLEADKLMKLFPGYEFVRVEEGVAQTWKHFRETLTR